MITPERAGGTERGREIENCVCVKAFLPLSFVPWAKAEREDGVWGRLNIK